MAMHTDLPIHKVAFDLLSLATDVTRNIPRDFKAGLGAKVRDECIEVMVLIARANAARDKRAHLATLVERVQVIEFLLRLFKEKRFISVSQHAQAIQLTASIGKQANAWKRATATAPAT
ncbi:MULTISPECIES: four helix bundle protein [unclassified Pseudomonas]|uniref:four helix bundle protein n=1 Tax=unclassified Pseudomonas TaxID=196821 RepID=UPI00244A007F|nr:MULTISPECIES: four helix bundle protein [unclassified Pseudomonas]MDG9928302.1 four helix bundle protein [Pseudomonas sp. GD04042]MDH0481134.1 four helix bundle protein [Pseudomonas sp. GD04015]MDH0604470.1 four helix bundle protein [Pseudomonas sp. GD03869]